MPQARPAKVLTFGQTVVQVWPDTTVTILPGGSQVYAMAQDNDEYRATAERLGYGADTARMSRDHELVHSALAAWLGLPESPTLRRASSGEGDSILTNLEEEAVMAIQKFATAAGIDLLQVLER